MAGYTPIASAMLVILVPCLEPLGISSPEPDTLLGFPYTPQVLLYPFSSCLDYPFLSLLLPSVPFDIFPSTRLHSVKSGCAMIRI